MEHLIDRARTMAARGQRPWIVFAGGVMPANSVWSDGLFAKHTLYDMLAYTEPVYVVRPTGLAQRDVDCILYWQAGERLFLIGTALAAARYCDHWRIPHGMVTVVPDDAIHGQCVWVGEADGRMVQARWVR